SAHFTPLSEFSSEPSARQHSSRRGGIRDLGCSRFALWLSPFLDFREPAVRTGDVIDRAGTARKNFGSCDLRGKLLPFRPDPGGTGLARMADALADPPVLSRCSIRNVPDDSILDRSRFLRLRAWRLLGSRPRGRYPLQLVGDADALPRRLHPGTRGHKCNFVSIRAVHRRMA